MSERINKYCSDDCPAYKNGCIADDPISVRGEEIYRHFDCRNFICQRFQDEARIVLADPNLVGSEKYGFRVIQIETPDKPFKSSPTWVICEGYERGRIITTKSNGDINISWLNVIRKSK